MSRLTFRALPDYIDFETTRKLRALAKHLINSPDYISPFPNAISIKKSGLKALVEIDSLADRVQKSLETASGKKSLTLDKVLFQFSSSSDVNQKTLPYLPHFDKRRLLKGMLYLTDVMEENGPIHFAEPISPLSIEKRRRALPVNYKERLLNCVSNEELVSRPVPILGPAGTLIIFDTNNPHHAGLIKDGFSRLSIRFDFVTRRFFTFSS